jgi:hypothetical protein
VKKGRFWSAILPVALFGLAVGYLTWYSVFEYPPHHYDLDFEGAAWIGTDSEAPKGYFIQAIHIPEQVADAWIAVAATDCSEIYVNQKKVATDTFFSLNVSNIHDITGRLHEGCNLIGVYVDRFKHPGEPRLLLKGAYTDLNGKEHSFVSDGTWRASSVPESQGQGNIRWNDRLFDHSNWRHAKVHGAPASFSVYHSETPPYLIGKPLCGHWMAHPTPGLRTAYFTASFSLNAPAMDAWVGIAGLSSYDLNVNGNWIVSAIYESKLDIYNIASLLRPGVNTIGIGTKSVDDAPVLFVQGYIHDGQRAINLQDQTMWRVAGGLTAAKYLADLDSPEWKTPVFFARYPYPPLGILAKNNKEIQWPLSFIALRMLKLSSVVALSVSVLTSIWLLLSFLHSKIAGWSLLDSLCLDSILHLPPLVFLTAIYLLKYDVRLDNSFPFNIKYILAAISVVFLLRFIGFVYILFNEIRTDHMLRNNNKSFRWLLATALLSLMIVGSFLRLHELDGKSLTHDEISMMEYTNGIQERGFPSRINGPYVKPIATYELEPFSILASTSILGFNDFGGRLHSVFWGTLQILAIFLLGKNLFGKSAGFFAAAIQTFHPWVNYWSRNAFHPQMAQFWATLTVLFLFKAMESDFLKKRFIYPIPIFFSLTYLSWEGTGFLLVALPLALVAYKAPDLSWLKNKHVWASLGLLLLVIFLQQSRRILYQDLYLMINGRLAELSLPQPFFLQPMYDPFFYINNFFLPENNMILTLVLIAGAVLVFKNKSLRYLYVILLVPILCLTNLLPIYAYRYSFYMVSFLILAASGVLFTFYDYIKRFIGDQGGVARFSASLCLVAMCAVIFFSTNTLLLKLYLLSDNPYAPPPQYRRFFLLSKSPYSPPPQYREDVYETDYRSASLYIKDNMQNGDLIITSRSYPFQYYNGINSGINGNYSLTTLLRLTMFFDISSGGYPGLIEKFVGLPIIKNVDELKEITGKSDHVWYLSAPDGVFENENDAATASFIRERFKVVYESYNAKVYLWKK